MIKTDSALYRADEEIINSLFSTEEPSNHHITDAARLFIRYRDTTHLNLLNDLLRVCNKWDRSMNTVQEQAKEIWNSGWRPGDASESVSVGSGADAE
jgi:hypothetical protein